MVKITIQKYFRSASILNTDFEVQVLRVGGEPLLDADEVHELTSLISRSTGDLDPVLCRNAFSFCLWLFIGQKNFEQDEDVVPIESDDDTKEAEAIQSIRRYRFIGTGGIKCFISC